MGKLCKHKKLILGEIQTNVLYPDEEPYKSGQNIELEEINITQQIFAEYCEKCEKIVNIWVE